jgi:hypothetical protein
MKKIGIFGVLIALLAVSLLVWFSYAGTKSSSASLTPQSAFLNTPYTIDGETFTFVNGVAKMPAAPGSASSITFSYFGNDVKGDLNSDGIPDEAFLMTQDGAGSGTFFYVVVALANGLGGYTATNSIFLGDRIAPQTTEIRDNKVVVNFAERKTGESFAEKPSVGVSRYFTVTNGKLVASSEVRH